MVPNVFIRNDDVCEITPKFLEFCNLTKANHIPILHAVIPATLTKEMIEFIKENNLQIVQHGYQHTNHGITKKYEFGETRSKTLQKKDIDLGWQILMTELPTNLHPYFAPPYHGFDETTLEVLGNRPISVPQQINHPNLKIHISLEEFKPDPRPISLNEFAEKLTPLLKTKKRIGICCHHEFLDLKEFGKILKLMRALHKSKKIQLMSFKNEST